MTTRLHFLPIFAFFFFNVVLSMPAFSMDEGKYGSMDPSKIYVVFSPQADTSSVLSKLRSEEAQRLQSAQTPEEKFKLGREFAFEKFGLNLMQDERDRIAVSLFEASGTPKALGNLGYLYKEDRAGISLRADQRYARAKELLERDNSPWALANIGDMYRFGKLEHKESKYDLAAQYYRKSRTEYSWYALGSLYAKNHIKPDTCCTNSSRVAHRCFTKAHELGYEVPKKEEMICGGFFNNFEGGNDCGIACQACTFGLLCLYIPCCVSYGCAESIPEDRL